MEQALRNYPQSGEGAHPKPHRINTTAQLIEDGEIAGALEHIRCHTGNDG